MGNCFLGFAGQREPDHSSYGDLLDSWDLEDMERIDKLAREQPIDIAFEDFIYPDIRRSDPIPIPKRIR